MHNLNWEVPKYLSNKTDLFDSGGILNTFSSEHNRTISNIFCDFVINMFVSYSF